VKIEHGLPEIRGQKILGRIKTRAYVLLDVVATQLMRAHVVYVTNDLKTSFTRLHATLARTVIHNGVFPPDASRVDRPVAMLEGSHNLLVLGRLEPVKNVGAAIFSLMKVRADQPVMLHVVGDGPERQRLQDLAQQNGVADRVVFHGFSFSPAEFLNHASVLVVPSWHEGLPYTVLEALAAGVPIVASHVGGMGEVLRHAETAMLVDPGDPLDIANAIMRVLNDAELRQQLRSSGRELAVGPLSAAAMGQEYLRLFQQLCASTRR
jgi:glycosyltransferase involved in cell wall biosynthesis